MKNGAVQKVCWTAILLLIWQMLAMSALVPKSALPPVTTVFGDLIQEVKKGEILIQARTSVLIIIEGVALAFGISLLLTFLSIWSPIFSSFVETISMIMDPVPGVALLSLIMVWFGIGPAAMLAIIIHAVLWPMVIELNQGYHAVSQIHKDYAKNLGLSSLQMIKDILLYSTMPYIISGLKTGWARAWRALISAEMIFGALGSVGGLGTYIYKQRAFANSSGIFVGILVITVIGVAVEQVGFKSLEKHTVKRWGMVDT